jgi:hypothetical protein
MGIFGIKLRFIGAFLAVCLVVILVHVSLRNVSASDVYRSQDLQACLPQRPQTVEPRPSYTFNTLAVEKDQQIKYYLIEVTEPEDPQYPWETLVIVKGGKCTNPIPERQQVRTLTQFMPYNVAQKLALTRYRKWLEKPNGKARIQRQIQVLDLKPGTPADLDLDELVIAPEDAWALKELGYTIPPQYKVEPIQSGSTR